MSLIDPIYLMTLMGTTPERQARPSAGNKFHQHMQSALTGGGRSQVSATPDPFSVDDPLMRSALQSLADLVGR